jgi:hypothetical protein
MRGVFGFVFAFSVGALSMGGCGSDDDGSEGSGGGSGGRPEQTGAACDAPEDCFGDVTDKTTLLGEVRCLDRVKDGYCTHLCDTDDDCCAADGECKTGIKQVCSPFESTGLKVCFLSCEAADRVPEDGGSGTADEAEYCQREAGGEFICRSSGGGGQNRKVCVPGDCGAGAACGVDADCATDLTCFTGFKGGYCAKKGCQTNADCGADAACVIGDPDNYCAKRCDKETDCTFCRYRDVWSTCGDGVTFVESGTTGNVCVPPKK